MKYSKFNSLVVVLFSMLVLNSSRVNAYSSVVAAGMAEVFAYQSADIQTCREEAMYIFKAYDVRDTLYAANNIVLDPAGLSCCKRCSIRTTSEFKLVSVSPIQVIRTEYNKRDETPLRIFFELCYATGLHRPDVDRTAETYDQLLIRTKRFIDVLGSDVKGHVVKVTIRGGLSIADDLTYAKEIVKSCLRDQYPQGVLPEKLEKESLEFANNMLKDSSTYLGFTMVGKNIAARKMYMALCARVLIEKRGELLSENACVTFAKMALQAHKN